MSNYWQKNKVDTPATRGDNERGDAEASQDTRPFCGYRGVELVDAKESPSSPLAPWLAG